MNEILAVIQVALVPILLAVALAVRFAGNAKPLNIVDYNRVEDPVALHRWAGNRLLLLPAFFCVAGVASFLYLNFSLLFFGVAIFMCLFVAVGLALGAERFQSAA